MARTLFQNQDTMYMHQIGASSSRDIEVVKHIEETLQSSRKHSIKHSVFLTHAHERIGEFINGSDLIDEKGVDQWIARKMVNQLSEK